ncbi:response regulator [Paenibacillus sp. S150]|uniref:response regulator transcription factor n=1 Tax=Paenibacillus sp. S150 TaxID=2749826 RepID=UPI001C57B3E5|nr:response regulator [Paenibacillus sp. S150]MBW4080005.1 response regulator [Paenibacillus sp. S150]
MHSVFIVDDEPWVVYGLKALLNWESLGFTVIGESHNGLAALELIKERKPDVILSDIRMPGLDGIELMDQIRQNNLLCKVILISGYSEFEYAQQAIRFGAFDYLLKQVDKNKLTETLLRLKEELEKTDREKKSLDLFLDDLFDLFESDHTMKIHNFLISRGIISEHPHYRFVSCIYEGPSVSDFDEGEAIATSIRYLRFRTGQNKVSYLINYNELKHPIALLDFISANLNDAQTIGISSIGIYSTSLAKLYQESDIALCSPLTLPGRRMIQYKGVDYDSILAGAVLHIELAMKEHKQQLFMERLDELCEECKARQMLIDQISIIYNQIVSLFYKYYGHNEAVHEIEYVNYYQIYRQYTVIEQLFDRFKEFFIKQSGEEIHISNDTVKKIINYVDHVFTEDIMLGTLSKEFNISIGYLSSLIKKETGKTYSEYIQNKRLSLAKELLQDFSLSIHEIVERVGYKDYFHFNKLFKKHYGITPSKYRKM